MCFRQGLQASEGEESTLFGVIKKVLVGDIATLTGTRRVTSVWLTEEETLFQDKGIALGKRDWEGCVEPGERGDIWSDLLAEWSHFYKTRGIALAF